MNNSKIIILTIIAIALIGVGIYFVSDQSATDPEMDNQMNEEETESMSENMDLEGIHIMSDGTVMLGNGETLPNATITEDGMIQLKNGETVEPTMDMREGGSMEDMDDMEGMEDMNN